MTLRKNAFKLGMIVGLLFALPSYGKYQNQFTQKSEPLSFKSATELTSAIRSGEISSTDLLNLYLDRIQCYNNEINAVVALDTAKARERAKEADKALAQGQIWGPLHGLPMTVKDVFEVAGMPTTSGDPRLKGYIPERNAIAVQRLIDAGAIIFGKTNLPFHAMDIQSYNGLYGTTNLVWAYMAIVSGLPATVAPVGLSDSGLPVGIQIIGAGFEDRTTIDFARGLSQLVGGFVAPPDYKD